jgi:hypothetical protein
MQANQSVHLYLDNDATGSDCTTAALRDPQLHCVDERPLYARYKDLNDWHQHIGMAR